MAADVNTNLASWSTSEASNSPSGSTAISTNLDDNLRTIQAVVRKYLATKGSDLASGTTTDLSTTDGNFIDITGTTTITGFGTLSAGMWKVLQFDGALTLTHNATSLILPGAANITTAAGDCLFAYSLGSGNWLVPFYQKASGLPAASTAVATTALGGSPAGSIIDFAGSSVPSGWLECDGSAVSRTTYATLYAAVADTWGAGNGTTTFNLPDFRGRARIGKGTGSGLTARSLAATGGEETHVLTEAELATHTHVQASHTHVQQTTTTVLSATSPVAMKYNSATTSGNPGSSAGIVGSTIAAGAPVLADITTQATTATNNNTGSGTAHNTMMPFAVTMTIIKY